MALRRIQSGQFEGRLIRRARKPHRCDGWIGSVREGHRCRNVIASGEDYVEGEPNDTAGGYGWDRLCFECAGDEAREAACPALAA